jgi:hypothetical protein
MPKFGANCALALVRLLSDQFLMGVCLSSPCRFLYQEREQTEYTMEMLKQELSPFKQV